MVTQSSAKWLRVGDSVASLKCQHCRSEVSAQRPFDLNLTNIKSIPQYYQRNNQTVIHFRDLSKNMV